MRFVRLTGAILPIILVLVLSGCGGGVSEAEERFNAGEGLQQQGQMEEAITEFDASIQLNSKVAATYVNGVSPI